MTRASEDTRVPKKIDNHASGVLSRTQIVWIAFVASMTVFGGFFVFTGPVDVTAPPVARVAGPTDSSEGTTSLVSEEVRGWTHIVIHHSGLQLDDHESIDRRHRQNGLLGNGYHFVIGNGFGRTADGAIVATRRWAEQRPGAHVAPTRTGGVVGADHLNLNSIGICLVGDGDQSSFSSSQIRKVMAFVVQLCREHDIPPSNVLLHRDVSDVASPGRLFPVADFEQYLNSMR